MEAEQTATLAPATDAATKKTATKRRPSKKAKTAKKRAKKSLTTRSNKAGGKMPEHRNKKAEVIALMKRPKGATLGEIMALTGWQTHTVRGFISILGKKGGEQVESSKNTAGERTYKLAR